MPGPKVRQIVVERRDRRSQQPPADDFLGELEQVSLESDKLPAVQPLPITPGGKYHDLLHWIAQQPVLDSAVKRLKARRMLKRTAGLGEALDRDWFLQTPELIRSGNYLFTPIRQLRIPNPRAVLSDIPELDVLVVHHGDRVVMEAIYIVLERIFVDEHAPELHSYQDGKGVHSALRQMKVKWKGTTHFIYTAIDEFYSSMDCSVLLNILREYIADEGFLKLIAGAFDAQLIGPEKERAILAPVLANIYLQNLDRTIEEVRKKYKTDKRARRSLQNGLPDFKDPNYVKIEYVRFAEDFLVGVVAPNNDIINELSGRICSCLADQLRLRHADPLIGLAHRTPAKFLGFQIGASPARLLMPTAHRDDKPMRKLRSQISDRWINVNRAVHRYGKQWLATGLKKERLKWPSYDEAKVGYYRKLVQAAQLFPNEQVIKFRDRPQRKQAMSRILEQICWQRTPPDVAEAMMHLKEVLALWTRRSGGQIQSAQAPEFQGDIQAEGTYYIPSIQVHAPIDEIERKLVDRCILWSQSKAPRPVDPLQYLDDESIIRWFAAVAQDLLKFYQCADNFVKVQKIVNFKLRRSAVLTLALRHRTTTATVVAKLGTNLEMKDGKDKVVASFPDAADVRRMDRTFYMDDIVHPMQAFAAIDNPGAFLKSVDDVDDPPPTSLSSSEAL